jgi:hypothetical protein
MRFHGTAIIALAAWVTLLGCGTGQLEGGALQQAGRVFQSSFESTTDFAGFYIVPPGDYGSSHALSQEQVQAGEWSHKAWILKARAADNDGLAYLPHRAYPTVQLHKSAAGGFVTPCLVTLRVWLDIALQDRPAGRIDDWFSFITLSLDRSDLWSRTVLANIAPEGYLRLVHVPDQGKQEHLFQAGPANDPAGSLAFPYRRWVRIDLYIDFSPAGGAAKLWQDGKLVSQARVNGGGGVLEQAHFGLYASAALGAGVVYNDGLVIREVRDEAEALALLGE